MADEIKDQNVIKAFRINPGREPVLWAARIGPDGRALWGFGSSAIDAIDELTRRLRREWTFDETWKPRDADDDD